MKDSSNNFSNKIGLVAQCCSLIYENNQNCEKRIKKLEKEMITKINENDLKTKVKKTKKKLSGSVN